jgi:hypothetical protein
VVKLSKPIDAAWRTSHVETDEEKLNPVSGVLKTDFNQFEMKSYRLKVLFD